MFFGIIMFLSIVHVGTSWQSFVLIVSLTVLILILKSIDNFLYSTMGRILYSCI
jgi:hypothetical protein